MTRFLHADPTKHSYPSDGAVLGTGIHEHLRRDCDIDVRRVDCDIEVMDTVCVHVIAILT